MKNTMAKRDRECKKTVVKESRVQANKCNNLPSQLNSRFLIHSQKTSLKIREKYSRSSLKSQFKKFAVHGSQLLRANHDSLPTINRPPTTILQMYSAFDFARSDPTPIAFVLSSVHFFRAGKTADARVAFIVQLVVRQFML